MRLDEYLRKIGVTPPLDRTIDTLRRLHLAHRRTFLFENLAIQQGRGISLALEDLERKFLDQGAGGYCFEHNTLFAAIRDGVATEQPIVPGTLRAAARDLFGVELPAAPLVCEQNQEGYRSTS